MTLGSSLIRSSVWFRRLVCGFLCLLLCCTLSFRVSAASVDDVRELVGLQRWDSNYTEDEIQLIIQQYQMIDRANLTAKLLELGKTVNINNALLDEYDRCYAEIEECTRELDIAFRSGAVLSEVLSAKTALSSTQYTLSSLRSLGYTIDVEFFPNEWTERYLEVQRTIEYLSDAVDIGGVGENMQSPLEIGFTITSMYGMRLDPFTADTLNLHNGVDLWAPEGSFVLSVWNGVVSNVYESERGGLTVVVTHSPDLSTEYLHLSESLVEIGTEVKAGDRIALSGNTGRSTGPHLHLGVRLDGSYVDPMYLFGTMGIRALSEFVSNNPERYLDADALMDEIKLDVEGSSSYDSFFEEDPLAQDSGLIYYPDGYRPSSGEVDGFTTRGFRDAVATWEFTESGWVLVVEDEGPVDVEEGTGSDEGFSDEE